MSDALKILIVGDHPLLRCGLQEVLRPFPNYHTEEAADGESALRMIRQSKPDICILDVNMPGIDGLAVVRQMREQDLPAKVIFLTMHKEEDWVNAAMDLDVKGYVLKDSAVSEIIQCVERVAAGHHYLSPALSDYILARRSSAQKLSQSKPGLGSAHPRREARP